MTKFENVKIGIWGFGRVGKSVLTYVSKLNVQCQIFDQRVLSYEEQQLIKEHQANIIDPQHFDHFLQSNDYIVASPGVDISSYQSKARFICELDIFACLWHKPTIGITGTIGKTTVTTLLYTILQKHMPTVVGGNIGTPMLDIVKQQNNVDLGILELSSWQLEYTKEYKPDIAIVTNLYPNHLDRHKTMAAYFQAKATIIKYQMPHQTAILPLSLWNNIQPLLLQSRIIWVHDGKPMRQHFKHANHIIYKDKNQVIEWYCGTERIICSSALLPACTFHANWLAIIACLITLGIPTHELSDSIIYLEHRLEKIGTYKQVTFYNDSKATTVEATLAALKQLKHDHIILFLGGLSKGVDRSTLIKKLPKSVKEVLCFGKEADILKQYCIQYNIPSHAYATLPDAFAALHSKLPSKGTILFSPSGSSLDLYTDYEERGRDFKRLFASLS